MKRIRIGDVFEIETPKGKAYLHYIYKDDTVCELIRVLQGLFPERPDDINDIIKLPENFQIFFPLAAAVRKKIVEYVGNFPPKKSEKPRFMRTEYFVNEKLEGWHIVDTDSWERELCLTLDDKQLKMSPWGIWNDTLLIERLSEGWELSKWNQSV